jgi:hypothetical protein
MPRQTRTSSLATSYFYKISLACGAFLLLPLAGCSKPKPMDIVWSADLTDPNGLARNPLWQYQKTNGANPPVCDLCPCDNNNASGWKNAPNCTDATLETNGALLCFGHWNWTTVEYEATVYWSGHSWPPPFDDDDYYFTVLRDDPKYRSDHALYTAYEANVEPEFNSQETVNHWDNTGTWWDDFHHNWVDQGRAAERINGKDVIIVGLAGIDAQHSKHTELHPVYAMFVHVNDDPVNDQWAFFVRNWGDEGYCSDHQENFYAPASKLQVLLRHADANKVIVGQNVWVYGGNNYNQQSWNYQPTGDGLLLTFNLENPSDQDGFVGDLFLNWTGVASLPAPLPKHGGPKEPQIAKATPTNSEEKPQDTALWGKFLKLKPAEQEELLNQLKAMDHYPAPQKKAGTLLAAAPAGAPTNEKPFGQGPKYDFIKPAEDPAGNERRAKRREAVEAFFKAHGVN